MKIKTRNLFKLLMLGPVIIFLISCAGPKAKAVDYDDDDEEEEMTDDYSVRSTFSSPDLAFFNLFGNVRQVRYNCEYSIPLLTDDRNPLQFDESGNCINISSFLFLPEVASRVHLSRNDKGEIIKASCTQGEITPDSPGNYEFSWNNGKLYRINFEGWEYMEEYTLSYDDGLISNIVFTVHSDGGNGETVVSLSDFKFDEKGNWTECRGKFETKEWDNYGVGEEQEITRDESSYETITRIISYY